MSLLDLRSLEEASGSGTAYSLTCATGTYTYTGISNVNSIGRVLNTSTGTYSYSGQNSSFTTSRTLVGTVGTYTYSGQASTLSAVIGTNAGSISRFEPKIDRRLLERRRRQQSRIKDDEEVLALILANIIRRK